MLGVSLPLDSWTEGGWDVQGGRRQMFLLAKQQVRSRPLLYGKCTRGNIGHVLWWRDWALLPCHCTLYFISSYIYIIITWAITKVTFGIDTEAFANPRVSRKLPCPITPPTRVTWQDHLSPPFAMRGRGGEGSSAGRMQHGPGFASLSFLASVGTWLLRQPGPRWHPQQDPRALVKTSRDVFLFEVIWVLLGLCSLTDLKSIASKALLWWHTEI